MKVECFLNAIELLVTRQPFIGPAQPSTKALCWAGADCYAGCLLTAPRVSHRQHEVALGTAESKGRANDPSEWKEGEQRRQIQQDLG